MWTWPVNIVPGGNAGNGSPVFLGLRESNRSSCAAPLLFTDGETEAWGSEIACPRSHRKPKFKSWLYTTALLCGLEPVTHHCWVSFLTNKKR